MTNNYKKLSIFYYSAYILAAVLAIFGYFLNKNNIIVENKLFIEIFKTIIIFYMLFVIPFALKKYSQNVKNIAQIENETEKNEKYLKIAKIRIVLIAVIVWVGVISYFILKTPNITNDFLYIAAIGATALIFCKPTKLN